MTAIFKNNYSLNCFFIILIFFTTSHTYTFSEAINNGFSDIKTYYFIQNGFVENVSKEFAHSFRKVLNINVGIVALFFDEDIWTIYRGIIILSIIVVIFIYYSTE